MSMGQFARFTRAGAHHVWEIRIEDESERLVHISRLTMIIIPQR